MVAATKPRTWYIQLIHVAKSNLGMDEQTYRSNLQELTGKTSCSKMNIPELVKVLEFMKTKGFKPQAKKKYSPKTRDKESHNQLDKLRQLWIQMKHQGFLNDGSEQALSKWAANQSKALNKGMPITRLEWLKAGMLHDLIEQLKDWHLRLLKGALPNKYKQVSLLNQEDKLEPEDRKSFLYLVKQLQRSESHVTVNDAYVTCSEILEKIAEQDTAT